MLDSVIAGATRLFTGVTLRYVDERALRGQAVYFANHTSHLDFLVIWSALPHTQRRRTRPAAARDYWEKTALRRYLATEVFRARLIERQPKGMRDNPLRPLLEVLDAGDCLIIFPEGTRSPDGRLQPFKPGLYHIAHQRPGVPLVPVHVANLNRILPKGEVLPVPMVCSATFGAPLTLQPDEPRDTFLERAHHALEELDFHGQ